MDILSYIMGKQSAGGGGGAATADCYVKVRSIYAVYVWTDESGAVHKEANGQGGAGGIAPIGSLFFVYVTSGTFPEIPPTLTGVQVVDESAADDWRIYKVTG